MMTSQSSRQSIPADTESRSRGVAAATRASATVAKQRIMPLSYRMAGGSAKDEERFIALIADRMGGDIHALPIGRARAGIYLLVKLAVRDGRRRVLMSPFTIPDVVTMVTLAGGEPVFYDFAPDSTSCDFDALAELIDDRTACVIVTHYHVNEPRLADIAALCRARGAFLFDDCAIAFGGSIDGLPIGALTDASIFSFSSFKLLNYFWGGLVTTRDADIADRLRHEIASWTRLARRDYMGPARVCLKYDLASRPALFGTLVFPLIRHRLRKRGGTGGLEHHRIESDHLDPTLTSRPSFAAFAEWWPKLSKVDTALAHRRSIARIYHQRLGARMVSPGTSPGQHAGACFVNFPVLVPPARCGEIMRRMMLSGYDVGRSLYPNVHRHPRFAGVAGRSANVDRLVSGSLYLPTHFGVRKEYAEEIAERLAAELE